MTKPCINAGCPNLKLPGRGRRYCAQCAEEADRRQREAATERTRRWRAENPEKDAAQKRDHYDRTADAQRARARAWHHANPERVRARREALREQKRPRVSKYGITEAEYYELLEFQGGACAICRREENGKRHHFDVDHDHATGAVRGLLCNRCNRLLSNAQDDHALLEQASSYLAHTPWRQAMDLTEGPL